MTTAEKNQLRALRKIFKDSLHDISRCVSSPSRMYELRHKGIGNITISLIRCYRCWTQTKVIIKPARVNYGCVGDVSVANAKLMADGLTFMTLLAKSEQEKLEKKYDFCQCE